MNLYLIGGDDDNGDDSQVSKKSVKCKGVSTWIKVGLCLLILYLIISIIVLLWKKYKSDKESDQTKKN